MNKIEKWGLIIYCILFLGWVGSRWWIFEQERKQYKFSCIKIEKAYDNLEIKKAKLISIKLKEE